MGVPREQRASGRNLEGALVRDDDDFARREGKGSGCATGSGPQWVSIHRGLMRWEQVRPLRRPWRVQGGGARRRRQQGQRKCDESRTGSSKEATNHSKPPPPHPSRGRGRDRPLAAPCGDPHRVKRAPHKCSRRNEKDGGEDARHGRALLTRQRHGQLDGQ